LPECSDEQQLFDELFPAAMIEALEKRPDLRWQEVVVDEAQDFRPAWWAAIEAALEPGARLRIFSDSNQAVYGSRHCPPAGLSLVPIRLSHNLRNTTPIHDAASVHYSGHAIEAHGPEGTAVQWRELDADAAIPGAIAERLRQLVKHEEVDPADVAVVFPLRAQVDAFRRTCSAEIHMADCESAAGSVAVDTIHRFKGLERPVVLAGFPAAAVDQGELAYVALSRARSHLEVFGTSSTLRWIRGQVESTTNVPEKSEPM
jgi:superfamily I DNA/RNA helicase